MQRAERLQAEAERAMERAADEVRLAQRFLAELRRVEQLHRRGHAPGV